MSSVKRASSSTSDVPAKKARKQRGSRNTKKNMRRNIDITEIHDYQEDKILEEHTGGPVADKANADLFFMDEAPDSLPQPPSSASKTKGKQPAIGRKARAASREIKSLKCLEPNPHVKGNPSIQTKEKKFSVERLLKEKKKIVGSAALKGEVPKKAEPVSEAVSLDEVWDQMGTAVKAELVPEHDTLKSLERNLLLRDRTSGPEISTAKAVLVPHPGQSYNPTFEDHQALLSKAVKLEESLKREEERIENLLPRLVGYAAKQRALMKELSEGLEEFHTVTVEQALEDDGEEPILSVNEPVAVKRKTRVAQNRQERHREKMNEHRERKELKKRMNDVDHIKRFLREIAEASEKTKKKKESLAVSKAASLGKPARLTQFEYTEPKPELKLTEELTGSLRTLAPEGNLIAERLDSFKRRNILEIREKQKKKSNIPWNIRPKPYRSRVQKEYGKRLDAKLNERAAQRLEAERAALAAPAGSVAATSVAEAGQKKRKAAPRKKKASSSK